MVVKMPSGCTSESNCQWICDNMVGATGAKKESEYKGLDSTTARRMLAEIKTEYTTSGGYEPDSTENTEGFDTEFVDDIAVLPADDNDKNKNTKVMVIIAALLIVVVGFIIVTMCIMKNKDKKTTTNGQYGAPLPQSLENEQPKV